MVRRNLCILYHWNSTCDRIYRIEIGAYVDCWIGPGRFVFRPERDACGPGAAARDAMHTIFEDGDVHFYPHGHIEQIYIPGMWDANVCANVVARASWAGVKSADRSKTFASIEWEALPPWSLKV